MDNPWELIDGITIYDPEELKAIRAKVGQRVYIKPLGVFRGNFIGTIVEIRDEPCGCMWLKVADSSGNTRWVGPDELRPD